LTQRTNPQATKSRSLLTDGYSADGNEPKIGGGPPAQLI
jgi:hypothetical protein